jgi:hypothetical protein
MQRIRSHIVKLFTDFLASVILISLSSHPGIAALSAQRYAPLESGLAPNSYNIGSPTLTELWVDPGTGNDANTGLASDVPLRTLTAAWNKIPATLTSTGYRINLQPGTYPCEPAEPDDCRNQFGNHYGTYAFPIIISRASGATGTVTIRGGMDLMDMSYVYLIDLTLAGGMPLPTNASGNNLLHLADMDHVLLRGVTLDGPDCAADTCTNLQEVLKVNQVQYLYVEDNDIGGAWHSSVDYFAVQYGHFINNNIHTAGQWCMYVKGGTSYLRVEGNEYHNCQLGFAAGQSANFPMMISPWLQYEAYDIKFINNTLHDLPGTALSVAGGYNILFGYNTLYKVGMSTDIGYPLVEVIRGERGCSATDELPHPASRCQSYITAGGWGPNYVTDNISAIPNRNVYFYNNIFYNPAPYHTQYTHLSVFEPVARPTGFPTSMPNPITTDNNLVFAGNVIWNGNTSMPLGIEDTLACTASNPTCNETRLRADNAINTVEPQLIDPAGDNFRPLLNWLPSVTTYTIPDFSWTGIPSAVPVGNNSNTVSTDFEGATRSTINPPGAYYVDVVPVVNSILRANASPTNTASVDFTVTFSEPVTGVDTVAPFDDFALTTSAGITDASITAISGSGTTYLVSADTGTGSGTIRLDVVDDDTILGVDANPLGGPDPGNGNFTSGQTYVVRPLSLTVSSTGAQDGWVLESGENTKVGGSLSATATTFRLGDNAAKKQYRSILSFSTKSLPDDAIITGVTLKIRKQGIIGGGNPVTIFQGFMVDIKKGYFGTSALQTADFQTTASRTCGPFKPALSGSWYSIDLSSGISSINKVSVSAGLTQIRLRFKLDDNNNTTANYLSLYSGNASSSYRPQLVIEYYVP